MINTIVTAMFKPDSRFTYDPNKNAVLYFAQMAEVDVQRLRKTGWETIALEDHEGQGHEVSDAVSPYFPRPESIIDKVDLQAHIQRRLGKAAGNKWLVLLLLHRGSAAGYEWQEIGWALQGTAPPGGWAQAGQKGAAQPRNPAEVWGDIKSGFDLPDWITVRGWFPPPPPNAGALRKWYCDGAKKLKRGD